MLGFILLLIYLLFSFGILSLIAFLFLKNADEEELENYFNSYNKNKRKLWKK